MGKEDTRRLKQIMTSAGEEAKRLGNSKIYPEHLFLGLLKLRSGRAIDILIDRKSTRLNSSHPSSSRMPSSA